MRTGHQSAEEGFGRAFPGPRTRGGKAVFSLRRLLSAALRSYKWYIPPLLPSACRYAPTCSEYMRDAVEKYGAARGVWMGLKRLARCHPLHAGGIDPVR